jgi:cell wall-associated NlpC family hydrolase
MRNARAAQIALRYLGTPYSYGGSSPSGFDCSGLVSYAYAQVGVSMAHNTNAIYGAFPKVDRSDLEVGDMVFFSGLGHMGIYVGHGRYVHAPHSGEVVEVAPMAERDDYVGAVRAS